MEKYEKGCILKCIKNAYREGHNQVTIGKKYIIKERYNDGSFIIDGDVDELIVDDNRANVFFKDCTRVEKLKHLNF